MKDYLKDYYFLGALSVAVLSGTMLTGKHILPFLLSRTAAPVAEQNRPVVNQPAQRQTTVSLSNTAGTTTTTTIVNTVQNIPAAPPIDEQKALEDQMDQVVADQNKAVATVQTATNTTVVQRAPASVPSTTTTTGGLNLPILKKTRPKQGGNEWVVGKSSEADSHDLSSVLTNADDSDIVKLESGLHDFGFHMIFVSKIEIRGSKDSKLNFKDSLGLPKLKELKISDVEFIFPDNDRNFISVGGGDVKFDFIRVKISHAKLTLNFREMVQVSISESQFAGVTFRFSNNSKGLIKDSYLEKAKNLVSLSNSADLEIINTQFYNFENVAITSDATETTFKAKNIKVAHGPYAFWGKFHKENTQVRESSFSNLKEFGLSGTVVNCSVCEKFNIER